MNTYLPITNWLSKLISLPFGRTRWSSRFFVLLDSEIRVYKDELAEDSFQTLELCKVDRITSQKPFCFQLDLVDQDKPWIIQCKSESEKKMWVRAVGERMLDNHPKRKANSVFIDESSIPAEVYRLPTEPLRCTNITKEPLLKRRRKSLSPITTTNEPTLSYSSCDSSDSSLPYSLSSYYSPTSYSISSYYFTSPPSPTGAVIQPGLSKQEWIAPQLLQKRIISHYFPIKHKT